MIYNVMDCDIMKIWSMINPHNSFHGFNYYLEPYLVNLMKMQEHGKVHKKVWQNVIYYKSIWPCNNKLKLDLKSRVRV
jgi:hypothetical protein